MRGLSVCLFFQCGQNITNKIVTRVWFRLFVVVLDFLFVLLLVGIFFLSVWTEWGTFSLNVFLYSWKQPLYFGWNIWKRKQKQNTAWGRYQAWKVQPKSVIFMKLWAAENRGIGWKVSSSSCNRCCCLCLQCSNQGVRDWRQRSKVRLKQRWCGCAENGTSSKWQKGSVLTGSYKTQLNQSTFSPTIIRHWAGLLKREVEDVTGCNAGTSCSDLSSHEEKATAIQPSFLIWKNKQAQTLCFPLFLS